MSKETKVVGYICYLLMAIALFTGLPLIVSMLLAWLNRKYTQMPLLFEHYSWIICTFWWSILWLVLSSFLIFTVLLAIIGYAILGLSWLWLLYRIVYGATCLHANRNPYGY